jgi:hypothetical protein
MEIPFLLHIFLKLSGLPNRLAAGYAGYIQNKDKKLLADHVELTMLFILTLAPET